MNQIEELIVKAALALADPFSVELISRAKAANPLGAVGKVKKVSEILELENPLAASVRYAAILARDYPAEFKEITRKEKVNKMRQNKTLRLLVTGEQLQEGMTVVLATTGTLGKAGERRFQVIEASGTHPRELCLDPLNVPFTGWIRIREIDPETRFEAVHAFWPARHVLPTKTEFVVFVCGKVLKYPDPNRDETLYLQKTDDNRLVSLNGHTSKWWLEDYPIPRNARLVAIHGIGGRREPGEI